MKFKRGDLVMVNRAEDAILRADQQCATGRVYLPGRGGRYYSGNPIDFLAVGRVRNISDGCVSVDWENPKYGTWWYAPEYLMPRCVGGF